jgi:mannosylglucosylglycerate synthase
MQICNFFSSNQLDIGAGIEAKKWSKYYVDKGLNVYECVGEDYLGLPTFGAKGLFVFPEGKMDNPINQRLTVSGIDENLNLNQVFEEIYLAANKLTPKLEQLYEKYNIQIIHVSGYFSYPISLSLTHCLDQLINDKNIKSISMNHDFLWERQYKLRGPTIEIYEHFLPVINPNNLTIVSTQYAADMFNKRYPKINVVVIPSLFDFQNDLSLTHSKKKIFRNSIGVQENDILIIQPSRISPPKGIHLSINLAYNIKKHTGKRVVLLVTGGRSVGFSTYYHMQLIKFANEIGVEVIWTKFPYTKCNGSACEHNNCIATAFMSSDIVSMPSSVEGFGNPVVESVIFKKPLVTTEYPVMKHEFLAKGFSFHTIPVDEEITKYMHQKENYEFSIHLYSKDFLDALLEDALSSNGNSIRVKNLKLANKYYSSEKIEEYLKPVLNWIK